MTKRHTASTWHTCNLADAEECDANLVKEYLGATSPVLAYLFTNGWEARGTLIPADLIESVLNHA